MEKADLQDQLDSIGRIVDLGLEGMCDTSFIKRNARTVGVCGTVANDSGIAVFSVFGFSLLLAVLD